MQSIAYRQKGCPGKALFGSRRVVSSTDQLRSPPFPPEPFMCTKRTATILEVCRHQRVRLGETTPPLTGPTRLGLRDTLVLAPDAVVVIVHYATCEELELEGGRLQIGPRQVLHRSRILFRGKGAIEFLSLH